MLDSFEIEINRYLRAGRSLPEVAQQLRELWDRGGLSHYDQDVIAMFLARSGQIQQLFMIAQNAIERETRVPWLAILEAFRLDRSDVTKTIINQVLVGCAVENRLDEISLATHADDLDPRFRNLQADIFHEQERERQTELHNQLARLEELRRDRLFEAEERQLDKLRTRFPNAPSLKTEFAARDERQAKGYLERRHRDSRHAQLLEELMNPIVRETLGQDDQEFAEQLIYHAQTHPALALELGIALLQMDQPELANRALECAPADPTRDALLLDVMIETRRFVAALEFSVQFEQQYDDHADAPFISLFARARSLWGLGRKYEAIQMLEGLLQLRPTYRSAHALLLEWKDERG